MDFKVAGTTEGITAIQMDIKIKGIDEQILRTALAQAREGRLYILDKMLAVIPEYRKELSKWAPKIISFNIDPDKIREVIGSGGKTINKIIEDTGVKIDIDDNGKVFIASTNAEMADKAKSIVMSIVKEPEVGDEFVGPIVRVMPKGALIAISPNKNGLIPISKMSKERIEKVEDVLNLGYVVKAKVIKIGEKGVDLKLVKVLEKND
ncbi:MAG: S1 RNA-binding domain-containing protein, partial [Clostridia bacterium]|nr:S1 RNA-binding domain-containing protein [Clostridia bacterium]